MKSKHITGLICFSYFLGFLEIAVILWGMYEKTERTSLICETIKDVVEQVCITIK